MHRRRATVVAWAAAVIALLVALLSLAPFVAAITLTGALVPLFAYTAWHGARLPSGVGLALCAAAFLGSPLRFEDLPDLLLAMAAPWAVGGVMVMVWWAVKPRRA